MLKGNKDKEKRRNEAEGRRESGHVQMSKEYVSSSLEKRITEER